MGEFKVYYKMLPSFDAILTTTNVHTSSSVLTPENLIQKNKVSGYPRILKGKDCKDFSQLKGAPFAMISCKNYAMCNETGPVGCHTRRISEAKRFTLGINNTRLTPQATTWVSSRVDLQQKSHRQDTLNYSH